MTLGPHFEIGVYGSERGKIFCRAFLLFCYTADQIQTSVSNTNLNSLNLRTKAERRRLQKWPYPLKVNAKLQPPHGQLFFQRSK